MAQSIFAPLAMHDRLAHPLMTPSSPDPTPLRMLAFSVAESALQSNPNSPMFHQLATKIPTPPKVKVVDITSDWPAAGERENRANGMVPKPSPAQNIQQRWASYETGPKAGVSGTIAQRRNRELWSVLERAKERNLPAFEENLPSPPPLSPSYNFHLPPNSPLAESIAAAADKVKVVAPTPTRPSRRDLLASLSRVSVDPSTLYTRSADPSPTQSTFSALDQSRPPPEFKPRLTAKEFSAKSGRIAESTKAKHARTQSDADSPDLVSPTDAVFPMPVRVPSADRSNVHRVTRTPQRLPSLQQIQAKMTRSPVQMPVRGHRRSGSDDSTPAPNVAVAAPVPVRTSPVPFKAPYFRPSSTRKDSEDSVASDVIQTPEDEIVNPLRDRRLALQVIMNRRPPTPPSPNKERLLPFLRERTSDRLAGVKGEAQRASTMSTPLAQQIKPVLRVTPPSLETRPAVPPLKFVSENNGTPSPTSSFALARLARQSSTPSDLRFTPPARLSTPPLRAISHTYGSGAPSTPISPTGSIRSFRSFSGTPVSAGRPHSRASNNSPTLSVQDVPIILCTPPALDDDSSDDGSESPDPVVVFDAVAEEKEEREERERRGVAMRAKLGLRRRSID